jgi:nicotinamide riboside transporter PnuC
MTKIQALVCALMGAILVHLGIEGDSPLHQFALVSAGVYICAAFTIKE